MLGYPPPETYPDRRHTGGSLRILLAWFTEAHLAVLLIPIAGFTNKYQVLCHHIKDMVGCFENDEQIMDTMRKH